MTFSRLLISYSIKMVSLGITIKICMIQISMLRQVILKYLTLKLIELFLVM
nr:MAG TPA: hypothetical protein [Caudoviricetes sp.]